MKPHLKTKSFRLSLLSFLVLAFFIFTAEESEIDSLLIQADVLQVVEYLESGEYQTKTRMSESSVRTFTGTKDPQGRWDGPVTITDAESYEDIVDEDDLDNATDVWSTEKVTYVDGMRHGRSVTTYKNRPDKVVCYDMSKPITCGKSALKNNSGSSAFQILSEGYPWYVATMNVMDIEDAFLEAYVDTLETIIFAMELVDGEFFDYYFYAALDSLYGTVYDSITEKHSTLSILIGMEEMKNSEFRLAVIDFSMQEGSNTFDIVITKYPDYLEYLDYLSLGEVNEQDFEIFCTDFDSLMNSFGPLDPEDPFFADSVDSHIYRSLSLISSTEDDSTETLKSARAILESNTVASIWRTAQSVLNPKEIYTSPSDVGFTVFGSILMHFNNGDIIRMALEKSFNEHHSIITAPTVTTEYLGSGANSGYEVKGYIHEDGGAAVTASGIAWATHYNPSMEDNFKSSGMATGGYMVTLEGLTDGVTYFARGYATNSAGTAYGNCVEFTATSTVGIEFAEFDYELNIYPNPASALTKFSFPAEASESMVLTIVNTKGQIVYSADLGSLTQGVNQVELDLSNIMSGIYHCQISANGKTKATRKLVILH